jgi:hypothetical protein
MDHDEARELFGEAIEGTLPPAKKEALDRALASDPGLREEFDSYRWVIRGAAALGSDAEDVDKTPDLLPGVQSKLRRRSRGRFYRTRFSEHADARRGFWILVATSMGLLIAVVWIVLQNVVVVQNSIGP